MIQIKDIDFRYPGSKHLVFRDFPWKLLLQHSAAQFSYGFDVFVSGTAWTLFVAVFIIGVTSNNSVYATTGMLVSVVFVVAIFASYTYGKIIDRNKGRELMRAATIMNALTHVVRPFIQTTIPVAGLNATNELATTGYALPYTRAVFDNADLSGVRVTYLGVIEVISNAGAACAAALLGFLLIFIEQKLAFQGFFFIGAAVSLLILTARFPLYKK
jgi:MFS family permease